MPENGLDQEQESIELNEWNDEWNKWNENLEEEWNNFTISLQNGKKKTIEEEISYWDEWIEMM